MGISDKTIDCEIGSLKSHRSPVNVSVFSKDGRMGLKLKIKDDRRPLYLFGKEIKIEIIEKNEEIYFRLGKTKTDNTSSKYLSFARGEDQMSKLIDLLGMVDYIRKSKNPKNIPNQKNLTKKSKMKEDEAIIPSIIQAKIQSE